MIKGADGIPERICGKALKMAYPDGLPYDVILYRLNDERCVGSALLPLDGGAPHIRLGICRNYRETLLFTLFHEVGEASGEDHMASILYAYEMLAMISGERPHLHYQVPAVAAVDRVLDEITRSEEVRDCHPRPLEPLSTRHSQQHLWIWGPYEDVVPIVDMSRGEIFTFGEKPITLEMISEGLTVPILYERDGVFYTFDGEPITVEMVAESTTFPCMVKVKA
jgi:hypothetical protein